MFIRSKKTVRVKDYTCLLQKLIWFQMLAQVLHTKTYHMFSKVDSKEKELMISLLANII
jgi:hypothetical protein